MRFEMLRAAGIAASFLLPSAPLGATETDALTEADALAGELAQQCASCHGEKGISLVEGVPSLAGQPEAYLTRQLDRFRAGQRSSTTMQPIASRLSESQTTALAKHYARMPVPQIPNPADSELMAKGQTLAASRVCDGCHRGGAATHELVPRLAGQREDYLRAALFAYRDRERASPEGVMAAATDRMPDEHIRALAHFFSHLP